MRERERAAGGDKREPRDGVGDKRKPVGVERGSGTSRGDKRERGVREGEEPSFWPRAGGRHNHVTGVVTMVWE